LPRKQVQVVVRERRWAVIREGEDRPDSVHDRKVDAIRRAREVAEAEGGDLVVFGLDGRPQAGAGGV
jgi:hypothetical protein